MQDTQPGIGAGARPVTLTFDNGPTPGITERILAILDRHAVRATFMVIGSRLRDAAARAVLDEVAAAGHWIGNHTLTHSVAFGEVPDEGTARREIEDAQALIGTRLGQEKLFRPYGNGGLLGPHLFSPAALARLQRGGYTTLLWNLVPGDWRDPDGWVETCIGGLGATPWPVVVIHDVPGACIDRLPEFLARAEASGFRFEQGFPDAVVATRDGRLVTPVDEIVAAGVAV